MTAGQYPYPPARREDIVEQLHGHPVADPYRWLEVETSDETGAWSAAQDRLWSEWLADFPEKERLTDQLVAMAPDVESAPWKVGERTFFAARRAGQDHAVVYVLDAAGMRPLVDPNAIDPDGKVTLDGWSPSFEGNRLAYLLSSGGDEESTLTVIEVASGKVLETGTDRLRYSPLAWLPGGERLFYVRRLAPDKVPAGEEMYHRRVYLHEIGTDPEGDTLIFGEQGRGPSFDKTGYLDVETSHDGRWLTVSVALGTAPRNDLYVARLPDDPAVVDRLEWRPVLVGVDAQAFPHWDRSAALWLLTDLDAPRNRVVRVDPEHPEPAAWVEVLGQREDAVLRSFVLSGDRLVALWQVHAMSEVALYEAGSGLRTGSVSLPGPGSASISGRADQGPEAWVSWESWVEPPAVYAIDLESGGIVPTPRLVTSGSGGIAGADESPSPALSTRVVPFASADGTTVRMTVISAPGTPAGPRPCILYGYGGFDVPLTPEFTTWALAWVRAGGVAAIANLRGGSEEGEAWHRDGMRENKHHVFEDFEAAADALVAGGWTTNQTLGIMGGSNGGLLVGAALTRSPERYAAVVCSAPLLDMIRYERFGLGASWNDEYGRADVAEEFAWLLSYSPYHNVQPGAAYPAVLFTIFDHDTRVDTMHARKLAALLQHATGSGRPVLVRREADVGHGARSLRRRAALSAEQLVWMAVQLGGGVRF